MKYTFSIPCSVSGPDGDVWDVTLKVDVHADCGEYAIDSLTRALEELCGVDLESMTTRIGYLEDDIADLKP